MIDSLEPPDSLAHLIAAIVADGERARFWAEHCGWLPGSGHCSRQRGHECRDECLFRSLLASEVRLIRRIRQRRRTTRVAPGDRRA